MNSNELSPLLTLRPVEQGSPFVRIRDGSILRGAKAYGLDGEEIPETTLGTCKEIDLELSSLLPPSWIQKYLLGQVVPQFDFCIPGLKGDDVSCRVVSSTTGVIGCRTKISTSIRPVSRISNDELRAPLPAELTEELARCDSGLFALTSLDAEKVVRAAGQVFRASGIPGTLRELWKQLMTCHKVPYLLRPDSWGTDEEMLTMLLSVAAVRCVVLIFDRLPGHRGWSDACQKKIYHLDALASSVKGKRPLMVGEDKRDHMRTFAASFASQDWITIPHIVHCAVGDSVRSVRALFENCLFGRAQPSILLMDDVDVILAPCEESDGRWERDVVEEICRCLDDFPQLSVCFGAQIRENVPKSLVQRLDQ